MFERVDSDLHEFGPQVASLVLLWSSIHGVDNEDVNAFFPSMSGTDSKVIDQ